MSHFGDLSMGGQKSMFALIRNLDKSRFEPLAIVPYEGELSKNLASAGCKVFTMPLLPLKPKFYFQQISNIASLSRIIRTQCISIVHPDHERDALIAGLACKFTNAKMLWHVRLTRKVGTDKLTFSLADKVIGIAEDVRNRFEGMASLDRKYITIYNGVDCDEFKPIDKTTIKAKLGLEPNKFIITFAGQFKRGKGLMDLIAAATLIDNDNHQFMLIGKPESENFLAEMKDAISAANLESRVKIMEFQSDIQNWFAASDIVVLPSHEGTEGMGRVLFEAMACGTAVIGTNISGVRQAISQETGLLVAEKSPQSLAEAITKLMADKVMRHSMEHNGRQRALEFFDIKNHAKNVEKIYEQLISVQK
ncbi:MAG: glycosyltransferase [Candidatus Kapabacteria bacterium]|nr:glycosyltransferase [Candidatus Kapabacteria bacterium]